MSIKLIAIDIAGTLVDKEFKITPEVKAAITEAREQGVKIVLCTGRPFPGVKRYIKELDLDQDEDYVITYNGSLVLSTATNEVLVSHTLDYSDFVRINELADKFNVHTHGIDNEAIYTANKDISIFTTRESFITTMPIRYRSLAELPEDKLFTKIMFIDQPELLDILIPAIPAQFHEDYVIVRSEPHFLEVLNKDAGKASALAELAALLNIDAENIMAIGDNENDLSIIEYAGVGVAMGNAVDKVKEAADFITKSNAESGVAHAIRTYLNK